MTRFKSNTLVFFSMIFFGSVFFVTNAIGQSGMGEIREFAFAKNDLFESKTSTVSTPVPGMEVIFQGRGNALVRFCANGNMFGSGTGATRVLAEVDGVQLGLEVQMFTIRDSAVTPRCYEWVSEVLESGIHTVTIFWRLTLGPSASLTGRFHTSILTVFFQ